MNLLCIDPGTEESGVVLLDTETMAVVAKNCEVNNNLLVDWISTGLIKSDHIAIEMIESHGMPVGRETFETCLWIGRFIQAYRHGRHHTLIYRGEVKDILCNSRKAKDANIRQALLDRYPKTGGGKCQQVGTKKQPGPLYGLSTHSWPALAVGHAWVELNKQRIK